MSDDIMVDEDDITRDYTPEEKKKIKSLLVDIIKTTRKIHQRYSEGVTNAFNRFHALLTAEAKERILKLEKPAEQAFSFGEFILDVVISMAGAGFLRAFVSYTSIKTVKLWKACALVGEATGKDINNKVAVGKSFLGRIQAKIQNDLNITADEFIDITKTSSRHATEVFLKKIAAYKKYVGNAENLSVTLGENLMELANYKSRITNSISDALEDEVALIESFKEIEDAIQFEKVINYINVISEYQLDVNLDEIFESWSDLVINFMLAFYFKQYALVTKNYTKEIVMSYAEEDKWAAVRNVNPFHGKKFADDILRNFPTKSQSFLNHAIASSGQSYTPEQIISDKTLGQEAIDKIDMRFMRVDEAAKKFKLSVYDTALAMADKWYNDRYLEFSSGVLEFTTAMTNFELRYLKR